MTEVRISSQLIGDTKLWRYMSLDKLVDLLSTRQLFFAPLSHFVTTDPYEGYLPAVAIEADARILQPVINDIELFLAAVDDNLKKAGQGLTSWEENILQSKLGGLKAAPKSFFPAIMQCITVNCWHANAGESEAMWRLYSSSGSAVAVETTVDGLKEAIQSEDSNNRVTYLPSEVSRFLR